MNIGEFKKMVMKQDDNITTKKTIMDKNGFKNFIVCCKKCGSPKTEIYSAGFHYSEGSEYTGIYGENMDLVFKCLECGNAEEINLK